MKFSLLLDLDGTVADCRHRHHLAQDRNWAAHSAACGDDPPVPGLVALVQLLYYQTDLTIVACSGRRDTAAEATEAWLDRHEVPYDYLVLRPENSVASNAEYKLGVVEKMEREGFTFVLAIDDYGRTAQALTDHGIPTVQVASYSGNKPSRLVEAMFL